MLELMLCSSLTLLPDFLFRRFVQGKRLGKEITLFSVWYELRWGITLCLILTVLLITVVLYNHPVLEERQFAVSDHIDLRGNRRPGIGGLCRLSREGEEGPAAVQARRQETGSRDRAARAHVVEVEANTGTAKADVLTSQGKLDEAKSDYQQALDEYNTKKKLYERNPDVVATRELDKLQTLVAARQGNVDAASAAKQSAETRLSIVLPAQKASAEAQLAAAQVELERMTIRAGVDGRVDQFVLRPGDIVQPAPVTRAAGILIPEAAGEERLFAGFDQIEAQVIKVGMIAEATCISKPMTIIPLVVTSVQDVIAAGQILQTNQLTDMSKLGAPGTVLVYLEPLYEGVLDDVPPGSSCIANLYSDHHKELESKDIGSLEKVYLHIVDTVALIHALVLRLQAVVLPLKALVFGGH